MKKPAPIPVHAQVTLLRTHTGRALYLVRLTSPALPRGILWARYPVDETPTPEEAIKRAAAHLPQEARARVCWWGWL